MNNEFTKITQDNITRYILESDSGTTTSGSVATVPGALGKVRKRGDNILAQEADKKTVPVSTPRNFVAKNAKTGGAGQHKDKKKAEKQGNVKHRKPFAEQGVAEGGEKYKVKSIGHDAKGDYYISPSTGKKVYKSGVKVGDHENPKTGEHKGVAEELSIKHQRDHSTQHYPDTSNSLATRSVGQAELPNVYKTADGHPTVRGRFHGKAAQTRVNPTITPTSVNRKDSSGPIPAFLKKGVAEEITADDMAKSAHAQGLKHGSEGSGNNMDRAKAQHGKNFKHYNAGFLKGRNEKDKRLKVFGQGYNKKRPQPVAEGFNGEYDDEAGMAHTNLLTSARAVMGLLKTIDDKDNLPEWVQEKIAKAEMMLVGVWDYLQSQKEQGIDPQQDANEADDPYFESLRAQVEELAKK